MADETGSMEIGGGEGAEAENLLANIEYTDKVKMQIANGDYHGFPESVDAFGGSGKVTNIIGGDGIIRTKIEIFGTYNNV